LDYEIDNRALRVHLIRDFNLLTARQVERLAVNVDVVDIDLSRSKIVDSVAIVTLHRLVSSGKRVTLVNPPRILGEAIRVLGLDDVLKLDEMVTKR
jgi:ABC-type transporter Mla MlaB component